MKVSITLLPKQLQFIHSTAKEILYSGGVGSGKSRILCYAAFREACKPHNEVLLIRKTLVSLKKSTLISLIGGQDPVIPKGCYEHNKGDNTITINGGGVIYLLGMDEPTRIRSMNLGCVCVDEGIEFSEEEYLELTYRLRNTNGSRQLYTATNPSAPNIDNWMYKRFFLENNGNREVITASSFENHYLPADYFDSFKDLDPQRKKRMLDGEWVALDNVIFNDFSREKHVRSLDKNGYEEYVLSVDWGQSHPSALILAGITKGQISVISEHVEKDILIDKLRSIIKNTWNKYSNLTIVYDPSAKVLANDLANIGITLKKANNDVQVGINRIHNRLANSGLMVDVGCSNLIREFESYQFKEGTEIPKKVGDDCLDALRYIVNECDDSVGTYIYPQVMGAGEEERVEEEWTEVPIDNGFM